MLAKSIASIAKHSMIDFFKYQLYEDISLSMHAEAVYMLGNGPSLNLSKLPIDTVIICNHFWRHDHYQKIQSGFHIISDENFLKASDIQKFIDEVNQSICIVCSTSVRKKLLQMNINARIICFNYTGSRPIWLFGVKEKDIKKKCQTGSTVIVDLGMPLIYALGVKKVRILGVDFDYGENHRSYAFNVKNSVLAPDWYMKKYWKKRAFQSYNHWVDLLCAEGFQVVRCIG